MSIEVDPPVLPVCVLHVELQRQLSAPQPGFVMIHNVAR
jgi:hypothetical protein